MDPLLITLTKAGFSAIIDDHTPGFSPVEITEIGLTDTAFTVSSTLTALPGEFKRLGVSGEQSGDDIIHIVALDASDDAYSYRGFALYLADGTLFGVYGQAGPIAAKAEPSATYIAVDIQLTGGMAGAITFGDTNFLSPPATTSGQGVVELATNAEASAGNDTQRALTPAAMQAAILAMLLRVDGAGSALDADLLDGQHGAWYADIVSRLGYVPFDSAGFTGAAVKAVLGYNPQDAADFSFGSNANGYWRKMPNGLIEQWGEVTADETGSPPALDFPIPFTDLASVNLQVTARAPNVAATNGNKVGGNKVSVTQFNVFSDDLDMAVFWRAIGR
ncbi:gp53-like domain-containing protein [Novosphingobium humi]|uniref:Putative tail fiber protein gp53-like C-terminal domain-containing protein n=1 Tax=Novosphingobium humi TaxID=2282397 RepID=A0ABY7TSV3_9SPHN|nr:hypothetical protein [Novosphingobium humi]WCT76291.1 hypothetical protein PQ457_10045 [Novosphingobium humi]